MKGPWGDDDATAESVAADKHSRRVWLMDELPKDPTVKILKREIEVPAEFEAATTAE